MNFKLFFVLTFAFCAASILSCTKESEEDILQDFIYCADSNVSYANNIQPILNQDCVPCHSGSNPPAGYLLTNYTDVNDLATSGLLMDVINHASGVKPMPDGKPKLNACKIATIQKWIDEGMLNN